MIRVRFLTDQWARFTAKAFASRPTVYLNGHEAFVKHVTISHDSPAMCHITLNEVILRENDWHEILEACSGESPGDIEIPTMGFGGDSAIIVAFDALIHTDNIVYIPCLQFVSRRSR